MKLKKVIAIAICCILLIKTSSHGIGNYFPLVSTKVWTCAGVRAGTVFIAGWICGLLSDKLFKGPMNTMILDPLESWWTHYWFGKTPDQIKHENTQTRERRNKLLKKKNREKILIRRHSISYIPIIISEEEKKQIDEDLNWIRKQKIKTHQKKYNTTESEATEYVLSNELCLIQMLVQKLQF